MNKKLPVASRICAKKQNEEAYARHLKKLQEIKLNNSKITEIQDANGRIIATSSSLLQNNKKKEFINELYYTEIERENRILLEKMSRIMNPHNKILISIFLLINK